MMSPVSRSATTHASAETSSGTGGVPGAVMMPQPDSASPPSGLAGTGSGGGGSPASGTSEESTAGGVDHPVRAGVALGRRIRLGRCCRHAENAGAANSANAAARENARVENDP